jgi:DNA-binding GntR family transcriptional regulator
MATLPQLKSISVRESAEEAIRAVLHTGRFQPGQPLSEAGLAAEMGISRGPVREALLLLSQEGLVVHSPNRGFSVIHVTAADLKEINQVRLPLEATALTMAKPNIVDEDVERLEELKNKMIQGYLDGDVPLSSRSDMDFHNLIWNRTGNSRLAGMLRNLLAPFFAYASIFTRHQWPDLTEQLIAREHDLFIDFLCGRIDSTAEDCVRFHLGM